MIIPLKPLRELEGRKIKIKITSVESIETEKFYSYLRLLREDENAEELFKI